MYPYSKVHGANMGPTWDRQDPGGPRVGHMNLAIWVHVYVVFTYMGINTDMHAMLYMNPCSDITVVQHLVGTMNVLCEISQLNPIKYGDTVDLNSTWIWIFCMCDLHSALQLPTLCIPSQQRNISALGHTVHVSMCANNNQSSWWIRVALED